MCSYEHGRTCINCSRRRCRRRCCAVGHTVVWRASVQCTRRGTAFTTQPRWQPVKQFAHPSQVRASPPAAAVSGRRAGEGPSSPSRGLGRVHQSSIYDACTADTADANRNRNSTLTGPCTCRDALAGATRGQISGCLRGAPQLEPPWPAGPAVCTRWVNGKRGAAPREPLLNFGQRDRASTAAWGMLA